MNTPRVAKPFMKRVLADPTLLAVAVTAAITAFYPFHAGAAKLAYFQDDFFYYLEIVKNIAATGRSTFDGTTLTNGYHPLWLLVLLVSWLAGHEAMVFVVVALAMTAGTVACYLLARSLCSLSSISNGAAAFLSAWTALFYLSIARTGMEIILTVPLMLAFARFVCTGDTTKRQRWMLAGLLASGVILSRLDTVLFFFLYAALLVMQSPTLERVKQGAWFAVGMTPFFLYLVSNVIWFGGLWPASSQAKHLKHGFRPDGTAVHSLFVPFGLVAMAFLIPAMVLLGLGCAMVLRKMGRSWSTPEFAIFTSAILFPLIYFGSLSLVSDWKIWTWYRYPFVLSSLAAVLLWQRHEGGAVEKRRLWVARASFACSLLLCLTFMAGLRKVPQNTDIYQIAIALEKFSSAHPGLYAMGDAAGTPSYLMHQPLMQLEGLVMDKAYIENIRERRPLLDVLKAYGVRYYVTVDANDETGCSVVVEPAQAGRDSPQMKAQFCQPPVDDFVAGMYRVMVFDVAEENARH